jgi:hypothetical protein
MLHGCSLGWKPVIEAEGFKNKVTLSACGGQCGKRTGCGGVCMSVIPALQRLRQENRELETRLGCGVRPCLKKVKIK